MYFYIGFMSEKCDSGMMRGELLEQIDAVAAKAGELCDGPVVNISNCETTLRSIAEKGVSGFFPARAWVPKTLLGG